MYRQQLECEFVAQVASSRWSPSHLVSPMMYREETPLFLRVSCSLVLLLFGGFGVWLVCCFSCFFFSDYAEFQPLGKMTCAHRTHGVSTRAKKSIRHWPLRCKAKSILRKPAVRIVRAQGL